MRGGKNGKLLFISILSPHKKAYSTDYTFWYSFFLNGFCIVFVHLKSVQRKLVRDVSRAQIGVNEIYTAM